MTESERASEHAAALRAKRADKFSLSILSTRLSAGEREREGARPVDAKDVADREAGLEEEQLGDAHAEDGRYRVAGDDAALQAVEEGRQGWLGGVNKREGAHRLREGRRVRGVKEDGLGAERADDERCVTA